MNISYLAELAINTYTDIAARAPLSPIPINLVPVRRSGHEAASNYVGKRASNDADEAAGNYSGKRASNDADEAAGNYSG